MPATEAELIAWMKRLGELNVELERLVQPLASFLTEAALYERLTALRQQLPNSLSPEQRAGAEGDLRELGMAFMALRHSVLPLLTPALMETYQNQGVWNTVEQTDAAEATSAKASFRLDDDWKDRLEGSSVFGDLGVRLFRQLRTRNRGIPPKPDGSMGTDWDQPV